MNKKLGDVAFITKLAGFEHTSFIQGNCSYYKVDENYIPLFIGRTVKNGRIDKNFDWYINIEISEKLPRSKLEKKCIVLPYVGTIGDLAIYDGSYLAHLGSNIAKIELINNNDYIEEFIYYFLKSPNGQKLLLKDIQGAVQKNITMEAIRNIELPKISIEKQNDLISVLEQIDKKIEINNNINNKLESIMKIIYNYWFLQFEFPNKDGNPYKSSGGKMIWNEELKKEIPDAWNVQKLEKLCRLKNGINYDKKELGDKSYKIVNVRNITSTSFILNKQSFDNIKLNSKQAEKYLVESDDILIARSGSPGAIRILLNKDDNIIFSGFIIACKPNDKKYKLYIAQQLKQFEGTAITKTGGSILQNVSQETLNAIKVILPNNDEIINKFNDVVYPLLNYIQKNMNESEQLASLRDFLLPLLMSGQVGFKDEEKC